MVNTMCIISLIKMFTLLQRRLGHALFIFRKKRQVYAVVDVGRVHKPFAGTTPAVQIHPETAPPEPPGNGIASGGTARLAAAVRRRPPVGRGDPRLQPDGHSADGARGRPGDGKAHTGQRVGLFAGQKPDVTPATTTAAAAAAQQQQQSDRRGPAGSDRSGAVAGSARRHGRAHIHMPAAAADERCRSRQRKAAVLVAVAAATSFRPFGSAAKTAGTDAGPCETPFHRWFLCPEFMSHFHQIL